MLGFRIFQPNMWNTPLKSSHGTTHPALATAEMQISALTKAGIKVSLGDAKVILTKALLDKCTPGDIAVTTGAYECAIEYPQLRKPLSSESAKLEPWGEVRYWVLRDR